MLITKSGVPVNPVGLGTWGIGGTWEPEYGKEDIGIFAIRHAISRGVNHIDTAEVYGGGYTDSILGKALAGSNREDLYIADKLWETSLAKGKVEKAITEMLNKLKTDYIDMLYIHKPWVDFPWREAIPQICHEIDTGRVRHFGVSNFKLSDLKDARNLSKHPVSAIQIHYNYSYRKELSRSMYAYCAANNIDVVACKPLEKAALLKNKVLSEVAIRHAKSPAQIALAWLIHQDIYVIPGATSLGHIDQNVEADQIILGAEDLRLLQMGGEGFTSTQ